MTTATLAGTCLCGAVKVTAQNANTNIGACHCGTCQRWGGGPLLAVDCGQDVSFSNEDSVGRFSSSEWAERGFCKQCGTHLFYHLKGRDLYMMPAGLFSGTPDFNFDHQVFIDEKPHYYAFANNTHNMTGAEAFASFAAEEDQS